MRFSLAVALLFAACGSDAARTPPDDAPSDTAIDPCLTCAAGQICVARYDGTCNGGPACVAKTIDCPLNACSDACQAAYCPSPYQCKTRTACGGESAKAFTCYGP